MIGVDPILAAALCALCYGTSTFLAGRATVRIGSRATLGLFQATGFLCALALLSAVDGLQPLRAAGARDLALAALSGLSFSVGWVFLGRGLAVGRTAIVATVECLTSISFVAVVEGVARGWLNQPQVGGIALAAAAAALVAFGGGGPSSGRVRLSVVFGAVAGVLFGTSYLSLGFVSVGEGMTGLVVMRFFAAVCAFVWLMATRIAAASAGPATPPSGGALFALTGGLADGLGTCAFVLATANGLVGVAVAILSLYAAVTVLLGAVILKERPSRSQIGGFAAGVAAIIVLAR